MVTRDERETPVAEPGDSEIITDGAWHRVGFTWDGSNRRLYVGDALVGEDTQDKLTASYTGIVIGCGKNMAPGTERRSRGRGWGFARTFLCVVLVEGAFPRHF